MEKVIIMQLSTHFHGLLKYFGCDKQEIFLKVFKGTNPAIQAMFGYVCSFEQTIRQRKESKNKILFKHYLIIRPDFKDVSEIILEEHHR